MIRQFIVFSALALVVPQAKDAGPKKFAVSDEEFPNPERGLMVFINLTEKNDLTYLREKGITLVFANVTLAAYRTGAIAPDFLASLDQGFQRVRAAGLKIVLRFTYSGKIGDADAPKAVVLQHIGQLKPLLQAHGDVLAALQAGFIGAWGEWHGSTHGNDDAGVRREVVTALLDAVAPSRMVQLRTPAFKQSLTGAAPLAETEAFRGTPRARLGHHNDAFFSDANDMGTYVEPVKNGKEWVAQDARFVVNGGETTDRPRGNGAEFIAEMERTRWSFCHLRYGGDIKAAWEQQGHLAALRRRLGYRFVLLDAAFPKSVKPGGQLELTIRLRNDGFAAPFNPRPLHVVLSNPAAKFDAKLSIDARRWEPGEHKVVVRLSIPSKALRAGYRLSLALPDDAASLAGRPEYAVRFANGGVWDAKEGTNVLCEDFRISDNAPGLATPGTKDFAEMR
jgi:uncharacterized protein DUF4832/uncharacterized protein DUF4874